MSKRIGTIFEDRVYKGFDRDGLYWEKFRDVPGVLTGDNVSFTPVNPYDCFVVYEGNLICLELKTTNKHYLTIGVHKMIKPHQVAALHKAASHKGICAGFLIEFREENEIYFIHINDFLSECNSGKSSINYKQVLRSGCLVANSTHCCGIAKEIFSIYMSPGSY